MPYELRTGATKEPSDNRLTRASDTILPAIAERWQPGEEVTVLHPPDRDFDSCIISTS